jgi:hypothetical protein
MYYNIGEFERFGFKQNSNLGILNIDIGVYFPWKNQDKVSVQIALLTDKQMFEVGSSIDIAQMFFEDITLNHRYPNRAYITPSKKKGRIVCKKGYPVIEPIETLNNYKWLVIKCSFDSLPDCLQWMNCFSISAELSKEKPVCELEARLDLKEECYRFITCEPDIIDGGIKCHKQQFYSTGNIDWHLFGNIEDDAVEDGENGYIIKDGSRLLLPLVGMDFEDGGRTILYDQKITLPAQTIDQYFNW